MKLIKINAMEGIYLENNKLVCDYYINVEQICCFYFQENLERYAEFENVNIITIECSNQYAYNFIFEEKAVDEFIKIKSILTYYLIK